MTILAIYCHLQGREVTELLRPLVERGFEFEFAPLGLEVGGQKWWDATMAAIDRAEAAIVYVTPEALADPTVEQRSQLFYDTRKPLFPMARPHFDPALVPRSSILHRLQRFRSQRWRRSDLAAGEERSIDVRVKTA